jgi:hypothetical protein
LTPTKTETTAAALLVAVFTIALIPSTSAEVSAAATSFSSEDVFPIPDLKGNIRFAFNGTYTEARFENNTWIFQGLQLDNNAAVQQYGFTNYTSLSDLRISASNSNVTVLAFLSFNFSVQMDMLALNVDGWGSQTVNLGLNATEKRSVAEWSLITDDGAVFLAEGQGWKLLDDNSVLIDYGPGNLTVVHYYLTDPSMANLSFLAQHYVAVLTGAVVAAAFVVGGVVSFRRKRKHANKR